MHASCGNDNFRFSSLLDSLSWLTCIDLWHNTQIKVTHALLLSNCTAMKLGSCYRNMLRYGNANQQGFCPIVVAPSNSESVTVAQ